MPALQNENCPSRNSNVTRKQTSEFRTLENSEEIKVNQYERKKESLNSRSQSNSENENWKKTPHNGVLADIVHEDKVKGEIAYVLKLMPGARFPMYVHPNTQVAFVLRGSIRDDRGICQAGECLWRTPGSSYEYASPKGALLFAFCRVSNLPQHEADVASSIFRV